MEANDYVIVISNGAFVGVGRVVAIDDRGDLVEMLCAGDTILCNRGVTNIAISVKSIVDALAKHKRTSDMMWFAGARR